VVSKLAAERATQAGVDIGPLLKEANLSPDLVNDAEIRIHVRAQIAFLELVARVLQDKWLGFHLAREVDLREFGSFYYLLASSSRLGDAFECVSRYSMVVNDGLKVASGPRMPSLDFEYIGVERHADIHQIEFWVTYLLRASRALTGRELVPSSVNFLHHREGDVAEMQRYYGCPPKFGSIRDAITFDPLEAELPNVSADPFLHRFLLEYYEDAIVRSQSRQSSLRTRVENAITSRLPNGTAIIGNIASDLGMSSRTLSRRLAEEGSTFSSILDDLRSSLANRYLQNNELSISQIAWLLGYTEVSSFAHAFQRWTGRSPTMARRQITHTDERQENISRV
jgi:AraC-like DNA-binding protein